MEHLAEDNGSDDKIVIILANGRRLKFSLRELRGFLKSKQLIISLLAVFGILVAADPYVFPHQINVASRMAFWALGILLYLCVLLSFGIFLTRILRKFGVEGVYWPIIGIPIVIVSTVGAAYLGAFFTDHVKTHLDLDVSAFIRNYLLAQAFEFLLFNFVISDHLTRQRMKKMREEKSSTQPASLVANGRTIFIDHIYMLEAKQHYVEITSRTGKIVVRSTLKTLLAQIPETAGLQVHRSYWVSRNVLVQLSGNSGKKVVHLQDGRTVPVSRPREPFVDKWFREQFKTQNT